MSEMKKYEYYRKLHEKGYSYSEIARMCGCSRQNVAEMCARSNERRFRPLTANDVVYKNVRKWMNENKVNYAELTRRINEHGVAHSTSQNNVSAWMRGKCYPRSKQTIDRLLMGTGLTYEEFWHRDDVECPHCGCYFDGDMFNEDGFAICPYCEKEVE